MDRATVMLSHSTTRRASQRKDAQEAEAVVPRCGEIPPYIEILHEVEATMIPRCQQTCALGIDSNVQERIEGQVEKELPPRRVHTTIEAGKSDKRSLSLSQREHEKSEQNLSVRVIQIIFVRVELGMEKGIYGGGNLVANAVEVELSTLFLGRVSFSFSVRRNTC